MKLEVIRTDAEWAGLTYEWNGLLANSSCRVPFLRHEYLTAWWSLLGGGTEWPCGSLYIVTAREQGKLLAAAPLFESFTKDGEPLLAFVGSDEISDYLDLLALPHSLGEFVDLLFDHLAQSASPHCNLIDLYNIREHSPTLPELRRVAEGRGWSIREKMLDYCSAIELPGDWETYLNKCVSKKERHEIRRKLRRVDGSRTARWRFADSERLENDIEHLLRLMTYSEQKRWFLTPKMQDQFRAIIHAAHDGGWLRLAILEFDSQPAAAFLAFDYDNRIWLYNCGQDPQFNALSPGHTLLALLIRWSIHNGRAAFDFLRGDEAYKARAGGVAGSIVQITLEKL
jgi:CelD/BcsL family acetyltransferase involved in cellulose biosynthesis